MATAPGVRVVENRGSRRNGAALSPETGVLVPPSFFFSSVYCVRRTEILVEQTTPQWVLVCDHAGLVINQLSQNDASSSALQRYPARRIDSGKVWPGSSYSLE